MYQRSQIDQAWRGCLFALGICTLIGIGLLLLPGCSVIPKSNIGAEPGSMFGDGGKTPCLDAAGNPCIHQPKQWLKPCK